MISMGTINFAMSSVMSSIIWSQAIFSENISLQSIIISEGSAKPSNQQIIGFDESFGRKMASDVNLILHTKYTIISVSFTLNKGK